MPISNWIKITVPTLTATVMLYDLANSTPNIAKETTLLNDNHTQVRTIDEDSLEQRTRREPEYITFNQPIASWGDELPPRIKEHYDEYTKNGFMRKKIAQAEKKYGEYLDLYSEGYNIPRDLLLATMMVESAGDRKLTSKAGAEGLLQVMPDTAKFIEKISGLDCDDLYDAQTNLTCGSFHLSWINKKMENAFPDLSINEKWDLTLAGYNRGHNGITKEMKKARAESFLGLSDRDTTLQAYEYVSKARAIQRIVQEDRRDVFNLVNFKSWPYSGFK
jgi:soluble lytic murein transglycosylase-like protein